MKNVTKIIIQAVIVMTIFGNTFAQQIVKPTSIVNKTFTAAFEKAVNVKWRIQNSVFIAAFTNNQEPSLAFIDEKGLLLAQGREIPSIYLPLAVKNGMEPVQARLDKKYGTLELGIAYEVISNDGMINYYILFKNNTNTMVVVADNNGYTTVGKAKLNNNVPFFEQPSLEKKSCGCTSVIAIC